MKGRAHRGRPDAPALRTVLAGVLLALCPSAFALDPALDVSQYAHTSWKIRDGFSNGIISSMAQTPDGYLWLGTAFGLLRFDGVRNLPWQPPPGERLPSSEIFSLLAARDGTLWIGTANGLASWKDGQLKPYAELAGHYIFKILEDHEGVVWASGLSLTVGRLCAIRNGEIECHGDDGILGRGAFNLYEDSRGNLWAGVKDGLWRWRPGPPRFYPLPGEPDGIQGLGEDVGVLLVGWKGGLHRFRNERTEPYAPFAAAKPFRAERLLRDHDGSLWIATVNQGLLHVHQGRTDAFGPSDGLSGEGCVSIFEDREGSIWVSTADGLDRFRDLAVPTLSVRQGLSSSLVGSVVTTHDGTAWLSTFGGLNRWRNGQITLFGSAHATRDGKLDGRNPNSLFQDDRGRIWVSTQRSFGYLDDDRFRLVIDVPGAVVAIAQDTVGSLWISNEHAALFELRRDGAVRRLPWTAFGTRGHASALAADRARGGLWMGFALGGLSYFDGNEVGTSYGAADGLGEGRVRHLRFDDEGALWVATEGGLGRLKNGRRATLNTRNGLPCESVHWSMEDDVGAVWLYTACGLLRVERSEMRAWAAAADTGQAANHTVAPVVFDRSDGVRVFPDAGHYFPQVAKSSDGKLWFLPLDGVSIVDPRHLPFNRLPPPVHIEQVIADHKTYDSASPPNAMLRLPPLVRDLQIDYTALSLAAPEKVRFRHKLEGWDRDWQDVGNRRQVFYSNLPPRDYRFRVTACNNSGVWNEAGAFLDFSVAPAYYQTAWFRLASAAALLTFLAALYRLRLQQVTRHMRVRLDARHEERERIARELHDTLLQSVQGLILKVEAVARKIPSGDPAREALEDTLDRADQVLAEARDRVRSLRGTMAALSDLPAAFQRVAREASRDHGPRFRSVVEGRPRELDPMVLEESFSIGREALLNALTHSEGTQVELEIAYDPREFRLRVRDDGRGIDAEVLGSGGRSDHWGLPGMQERARKIGAHLDVWSRPGAGTEVELKVPAATAYSDLGVPAKTFWSWPSSGVRS
jgi:signal transduction histidine kinase/ligand-binding sensor domain-containing protein